ncbi:hypothetical protein Sa4125_12180 [Aureimonas sp. SA4125]|uniref:hypothetical protein n=1 Tax=Aureimonas sp. SA4125 TaxID=2826993 RepID=UPI001CC67D8D|nr:hypothetical protein [Aureimonas sp. SA4125]BDA83676.1 hypothetical protein Sa4125_12180 [Aureimonas sp. SA4125]
MAVMLFFPHRPTAEKAPVRRAGLGVTTAEIVILPCIRREAIVSAVIDAPVLLKA